MPTFTCYPFLHQNKPSRESIFCGKVGDWWIKRALIMLNFLLKTRQKRLSHICTHGNGTENMYLFCRYKPFVLPLQTFCSAAISRLFCCYKPFVLSLQTFCSAATNLLFCRYKPFVLPLQASCTAATSRLYCHYKPLVAGLQAAL